jgi:rod shape determining protein RodA
MFFLRQIDIPLTLFVFALVIVGLLALASINFDLFLRQLILSFVASFFVILIILFDWRPYINYRGVVFGFYLLSIFLLIITVLFAPVTRGIRAWISFGPINFQTSELVKLIFVIFLSYFLGRKHIEIKRFSVLVISFAYFLLPVIFLLSQPDFGSVLILFSVWFGLVLVSGMRFRHLVVFLIIFCLVAVFGWEYILKDYQKSRIMGFLFPERDPLGINYSVIQSKIAIGSAGFFGKGFKQGTQVQLGFLPEASTDFIFSAFVEEWGIFGGLVLIFLFALLFLRLLKIALLFDGNFEKFICLGAVFFWGGQFIFNVGSNLGFNPVVGLTLPFVSYGGSSLLVNLLFFGIIQSLYVRRSLV